MLHRSYSRWLRPDAYLSLLLGLALVSCGPAGSDRDNDNAKSGSKGDEDDDDAESGDEDDSGDDDGNDGRDDDDDADSGDEDDDDSGDNDDSGNDDSGDDDSGDDDSGDEDDNDDDSGDDDSGDDDPGDDDPDDDSGDEDPDDGGDDKDEDPKPKRDCTKIEWGQGGSPRIGQVVPRYDTKGYLDANGDNTIDSSEQKQTDVGMCQLHLSGKKCAYVLIGSTS